MSETRLTKVVYNELATLHRNGKKTAFKYVDNINSLLIDKGLDFMVDNKALVSAKHVKKAITHQYAMEFNNTLYEKTSLLHYRVVKENTFQPSYLKCQNVGFKAIQLKFKLRGGVSGIGEDLYRQHRGTGMCSFCGEFESLKHVLLQCHAYQYERQKMISNIKDNCDEATFSLFLEDMYNVLGDHDNLFNKPFLMYLLEMWKIRNSD